VTGGAPTNLTNLICHSRFQPVFTPALLKVNASAVNSFVRKARNRTAHATRGALSTTRRTIKAGLAHAFRTAIRR
jgi:hypothetical protein